MRLYLAIRSSIAVMLLSAATPATAAHPTAIIELSSVEQFGVEGETQTATSSEIPSAAGAASGVVIAYVQATAIAEATGTDSRIYRRVRELEDNYANAVQALSDARTAGETAKAAAKAEVDQVRTSYITVTNRFFHELGLPTDEIERFQRELEIALVTDTAEQTALREINIARSIFTLRSQLVAVSQASLVLQASGDGTIELQRVQAMEAARAATLARNHASRRDQRSRTAVEAELERARAAYDAAVSSINAELERRRDELNRFREDLQFELRDASPEELELRQRFADGDASVFDRIQELTAVRQQAQRIANDQRQAAQFRELARDYAVELARQVQGTSRIERLRLWDRAAELEPYDFLTQIERVRLALEIGDFGRAQAAAALAGAVASSDEERLSSALELAGLLIALNELNGANIAANQAVTIARRQLAATPSSTELRQNLSNALERLADVAVASQDIATARTALGESLTFRRQIVAEDLTSAQANRDLGQVMLRLAELPDSNIGWADVAAHWRTMRDRAQLTADDAALLELVERRASEEAQAHGSGNTP